MEKKKRSAGEREVKYFLPEFEFTKTNTALFVIDMQYLNAHWDYGLLREAREAGFGEKLQYIKNRLQEVIPKIRSLQEKFREKGMEVLHVRTQSLTMDGRDRSHMHKNLKIIAPPGSKEAQFIESIQPMGDEIIINKTSSSIFNSTNIDYVLRNMRIECLVLVGMMSSVETTARDAYETKYYVKTVEDACCAPDHNFHKETMKILPDLYGKIMQTQKVLEILEKIRS